MTIDYNRLRELADYSTPGPWRTDEHQYMYGQSVYGAEGGEVAQHLSGNNAELVALAPDMARELLRLHHGAKDQTAVVASVWARGKVKPSDLHILEASGAPIPEWAYERAPKGEVTIQDLSLIHI